MAINWQAGLQELKEGTEGYTKGAQNIQHGLEQRAQIVQQSGAAMANMVTSGASNIANVIYKGREQKIAQRASERADEQLKMDYQRLNIDKERFGMEQATTAQNLELGKVNLAKNSMDFAHNKAEWDAKEVVAEEQIKSKYPKAKVPEGVSKQAALSSLTGVRKDEDAHNLAMGQLAAAKAQTKTAIAQADNIAFEQGYKIMEATGKRLTDYTSSPYYMYRGAGADSLYKKGPGIDEKVIKDDQTTYDGVKTKTLMIKHTQNSLKQAFDLAGLQDDQRPQGKDGLWDGNQIDRLLKRSVALTKSADTSEQSRGQQIYSLFQNLELENRIMSGGQMSNQQMDRLDNTLGSGLMPTSELLSRLQHDGIIDAAKAKAFGDTIASINLPATIGQFQEKMRLNRNYIVDDINSRGGLASFSPAELNSVLWNAIPLGQKFDEKTNPTGLREEDFKSKNRMEMLTQFNPDVGVNISAQTTAVDALVHQARNYNGDLSHFKTQLDEIKKDLTPAMAKTLDMTFGILSMKAQASAMPYAPQYQPPTMKNVEGVSMTNSHGGEIKNVAVPVSRPSGRKLVFPQAGGRQ